MKKFISVLIAFSFLAILPSFSQGKELWGISGIKQGENMFFEINGTTIDVITEKGNIKEKGIKKIIKKNQIKEDIKQYTDASISEPHVIVTGIEKHKDYPDMIGYKYCYIQPINEKEIQFVCFQSALEIEPSFIQSFMKLYFDKELEKYTTTDMRPTEVNFVGKTIDIGNGCYWQYVNNLKSNDGSQLNWSIFESKERAQQYLNFYIDKNNKPKGAKILSHDDVNIIFDGEPTIASKYVAQLSMPKFLTGPYNILIVYYVIQKVDDHYVSCILSYYTTDKESIKLPYVLSRFMQLDNNT